MGRWQRAPSMESSHYRSDTSAHLRRGAGRNEGGWGQGWWQGSHREGESAIPGLFPQTWLAWVPGLLLVTHSLHLVGCLQDHTDLSTQGTGWQDLRVRAPPWLSGRWGGRGCSGVAVGAGFRIFTWWRNCIICLKTPFLLYS